MTDQTRLYQNIVITLLDSDGNPRRIKATVPKFCEYEEELQFVGMKVTEPMELAEDLFWSDEALGKKMDG